MRSFDVFNRPAWGAVMLRADSHKWRKTSDNWFNMTLSTASPSSAPRLLENLGPDIGQPQAARGRSSRRRPSRSSRSAIRRLMVETGSCNRCVAATTLFASMIFAKIIRVEIRHLSKSGNPNPDFFT